MADNSKKLSSKPKKKYSIEIHNSFGRIDKKKFRSLISDSFHRALVVDYFTYAKPRKIIIVTDKAEYIGTVVLEKAGKGIDYLDKIAVGEKFQHSGIGKRMLKLVDESSKKLLWRAKRANPINDFYKKECDGLQKKGGWIIYWRGLDYDDLKTGIKYAISKKETLEEIK